MGETFCVNHHFIGSGDVPLLTDDTGSEFVKAITGAGPPTASYVGDVDGTHGVLQLALEATSEVQNVCVYTGDILAYDIEHIKRAEFRARLSVALGSAAATTQVAFGLASERNATIDSIAEHALFRVLGDASGAVTVETDDGTTDLDDKATGQTLTTGWKLFVIDFTQGLTDVRFFMDDSRGLVRVASGTTFDMSGYTGGLQFFAQIQKAANTNLGTLQIDRFKIEFREV